MATYGKFEVIIYPSFFVVTNMETHEWATKPTSNRAKAHRLAKLLMEGKPIPSADLPEPEPVTRSPSESDGLTEEEERDMAGAEARERAEAQARKDGYDC